MRNRSLAVLIIAIWFLVRGGVSLLEILPLVSRVSGHMYFFPVIGIVLEGRRAAVGARHNCLD
jgi:hypothetical protein